MISLPPALQLSKMSDKMIVSSAEEDALFLQRLYQQIQADPQLASSGVTAGDSQQMFLDTMKRLSAFKKKPTKQFKKKLRTKKKKKKKSNFF